MSAKSKRLWRSISLVMVFMMALSPMFASSGRVVAQGKQPEPKSLAEAIQQGLVTKAGEGAPKSPSSAPAQPKVPTEEEILAKLYPSLRELVRSAGPALPSGYQTQGLASQKPIIITIITRLEDLKPGEPTVVDRLKKYFVDGKLYAQPPAGFGKLKFEAQLLSGLILPRNILKAAYDPAVIQILPAEAQRSEYDPVPADDTKTSPSLKDWATLRANADKLRAGSLPWSQAKAFGDGRERMQPQDWYEMSANGPAKAELAWARGYKGEGVAVSVIDDGVDFAHPDIMGAQKIYNSTDPSSSAYNGWPMAMDPFSMRAYFYDLLFGTTYVSGGFGGVTYIDTSATPVATPCAAGVSCFSYTPTIDYNTPGFNHTYIISNTMTQSGVIHVGTHIDESLRDYVWGEKVAVLVADPNTAGVYDTVFVDLDDDYDFRDEKPLTRAIPGVPSTYNNMIAYRDMNGDGLADLSGGMLYFIADGVNYVPAMDWLFAMSLLGVPAPGNGDLIAIHGPWNSGYSHGTQCASNVVANGTINGMLPEFRDLAPGPGVPAAAIFGAAPEADLVPMNSSWSFSGNITYADAYMLAAYGYDGWAETDGSADTDAIQVTSNSYGWSEVFNDGFDYEGKLITFIQNYLSPSTQFLFATGNGGPGYGTTTPPDPGTGIKVGASSEFGSTGWDTITDTNQIMNNDVVWFSNGGPSARAGTGVDVLAGGAYAAGAEALNHYSISFWGVLDGNLSWDSWGGTSRASPTTMGVLALIYQAYFAKHGVWPTAALARAILMASATDLKNDVFKQGAGAINADIGTRIADGNYGVYPTVGDWSPGDYRGVYFPGFAHLVEPGGTYNKTFTLRNDGVLPVTVGISDKYLEKIGEQEYELTVTPQMTAAESVFGAANRDNFYKAFNYFIPITAKPGNDPSWYNINIPADTELMVVRQIFPYDEYDVNSNYAYDNRFYLTVYNWKDINSDGKVWVDKNTNGVVNFINDPSTYGSQIDGALELAWNDPRTEVQRWEYGRFQYSRPVANVNELLITDPLGRMYDGMFVGLRHLFTNPGKAKTVHLAYTFEFYKKVNVPWLTTSTGSLVVPAGGSNTFGGTINVPADMPPGDYSAAIEVQVPAAGPVGPHTEIIPVAMNVAATIDDTHQALTLGGEASNAFDTDRLYNNGVVRGFFDWSWREESGDWRAFYLDVQNECQVWGPPVEVAILTENFDAAAPPALPAGWASWTSTTTPIWQTHIGTRYPSGNPAHSSPNLAYFNSYSVSSGSARLYRTSGLDATSLTTLAMTFWAYHDTGYSSSDDTVQAQVSTDGGSIWTSVGPLVHRYDGSTGWKQVTVDLSAYIGEGDVRIGFLGVSDWGNDVHIDDIEVSTDIPECLEWAVPPGSNLMVKDEWADAAPYTDIDTVVLGPSPDPLQNVEFGAWAADFSDPAYFGPYNLDVVAQSADVRAGRSVWVFNTTSGGNQDWVTTPVDDGLYELMQHNVLYQGDQFGVVFTKTVGLLKEDQHSFDIDAYVDQGVVGKVRLESTLDLNSLVSEGFIFAADTQVLTDEPLPFTGGGTIEWVLPFSVENGVDIELTTSSSNIADLDLYLFYWNGSTYQQIASSAGVDANEHILYKNPPDGDYLVAVDNYSGPDGTFNLTKVVRTRQPGITVELPGGPIAANTPVTATIRYDYPFVVGEKYGGMVYIGVPEAPQLKQIPITITRLPESAVIQKSVDFPTHFAGDLVNYKIDLLNMSDPGAFFDFSDPIPPGTEFVSVSNATYNPGLNRIEYSGPLAAPTPFKESFEGATFPPAGWSQIISNPGFTWEIATFSPKDGLRYADVVYDPALVPQDEWLISSPLLLGNNLLSVWSFGSVYWAVTPYDNYDLEAWIVVGDDPQDGDDIFLGKLDDDWVTTWVWANSVFDLSAFTIPDDPVRLGFRYVGVDGAEAALDLIEVDVFSPVPRTVDLTVKVLNTVTPGDFITNTATLVATHFKGQVIEQVEPPVDAKAVFHIGLEDLLASFKEATAEARAGDVIEYLIHLINTGDKLAQNVMLVDPIPAGTSYEGHDPGFGGVTFNYNGAMDQMEWNGNLAPGEEVVLDFWVVANAPLPPVGKITNTATVTWNSSSMLLEAVTKLIHETFMPFTINE